MLNDRIERDQRTEDRIAHVWGERTPYARGAAWPTRIDTHLADGVGPEHVDRWVQTASTPRSNGDASDIGVRDGRIVGVRGRPGQPRQAG